MDLSITFKPEIIREGNPVSHSVVIKTNAGLESVLTYLTTNCSDDYEIISVIPAKELFTIDDVRRLQKMAQLRTSRPRMLMVSAPILPVISQNALLKLLEDGSAGTVVVIVTSLSQSLLDTVVSRVFLSSCLVADSGDYHQFVSTALPQRFDYLGQYITPNQVSGLAMHVADLLRQQGQNDEVKNMLDLHRSWQSGALVTKYFFEYMCLICPENSQSND